MSPPQLPPLAGRLLRVLDVLLVCASAMFAGLYFYTALSRITFPFDLEWGEGLFADHVARLVHGRPLYAQPSLNFVALVYTPGYYYLASIPARIVGVSVPLLRGVSLACSVALLVVLVAFGAREGGRWRDGCVVAGLFIACYAIGGAWMDIARVDALLLLLLMASLYLARFGQSTLELSALGLFLACGVLTKQVALTLAPPILLSVWLRVGRSAAISALVFGVVVVGAGAYLQLASRGWFLYYTLTVLSKAQTAWNEHPLAFWSSDLFGLFPIGTLLGLGWCLAGWRTASFRDYAFYAVNGAGILASTWEARIHPGAWFNTLLPAFLLLSIAATRAARELDARWPGVGSTLLLIQFALLIYNPRPFLPSPADYAAAREVVELMRRSPGDVLLSDHAFYATLAGKRSHAHEMAVRDVLSTNDRWADDLRAQYRRAIDAEQFDAIVLDSREWFPIPIVARYRPLSRLLSSDDLLKQRVGNPVHPGAVYLPKTRHVVWPPPDQPVVPSS